MLFRSAHLRAHTDICAQTVHVSCSVILLVDMCLGVGLLNHMVLLGLVPSGTSILFSIVALPTHIPTNGGGVYNSQVLVAQSCLTLCDRSLPGFSVHGILSGKNTGESRQEY